MVQGLLPGYRVYGRSEQGAWWWDIICIKVQGVRLWRLLQVGERDEYGVVEASESSWCRHAGCVDMGVVGNTLILASRVLVLEGRKSIALCRGWGVKVDDWCGKVWCVTGYGILMAQVI